MKYLTLNIKDFKAMKETDRDFKTSNMHHNRDGDTIQISK